MSLPPGSKLPTPLVTWNWFKRPYPFLDECAAKHGETFTVRLAGLPPLVFFSNPDHVREVFADDGETLAAGEFNRTLAPLLGDTSVLMVDGKRHIRKRKLLLPPFHGERMHAYGADMHEITARAIAKLPRGEAFSLHEVMQDITLEVIVRTVFGFVDGPRYDDMVRRTKRVLELGAWPPLLLPFMQFEANGYSPYGRFKRASAESDQLIFDEIRRRRASGERGKDILSLLLDAKDESGEVPSEEELRDELVTLLVAGHETTATGLTWAFRWLLDQPATFAELRAAVDAMGRDPSPAALAKNDVLDSTVREALRLVPVIPLVARVLKRPMKLGGWDLPAGTVVACSIYLAHRRASVYPRPTEFDPMRFVGTKMAPSEFFPFGGGLRRCIGMAFALYEMKIVLGMMLSRIDLRLAHPGREIGMVRRSITLTPEKGLRVTMRERRRTPVAQGSTQGSSQGAFSTST
jgi:cytochrome P450